MDVPLTSASAGDNRRVEETAVVVNDRGSTDSIALSVLVTAEPFGQAVASGHHDSHRACRLPPAAVVTKTYLSPLTSMAIPLHNRRGFTSELGVERTPNSAGGLTPARVRGARPGGSSPSRSSAVPRRTRSLGGTRRPQGDFSLARAVLPGVRRRARQHPPARRRP